MNTRFAVSLSCCLFFLQLLTAKAWANAHTASDVIAQVERYQRSMSARQSSAERPSGVSNIWQMRFPGEDKSTLTSLDWQAFTALQSPIWNLSSALVQNLHLSHGRLAIVRLDDLAAPNSALLALLKTENAWQVVTDVRTQPTCRVRNPVFSRQGEHKAVLAVLGDYYQAVTQESPATLDKVFHPQWRMKNHEKRIPVSEGVVAFKARLQGNQHSTYSDDREIADIQVLYQCLAMVRVNKPSSGGSTFFFFVRSGGRWWMTDKLWTSAEER